VLKAVAAFARKDLTVTVTSVELGFSPLVSRLNMALYLFSQLPVESFGVGLKV